MKNLKPVLFAAALLVAATASFGNVANVDATTAEANIGHIVKMADTRGETLKAFV